MKKSTIRIGVSAICFWLLAYSMATNAQESVSPKKAADTIIQQGVQGSPNPLRDNSTVLTGTELLDESFPGSWPLFGEKVRLRIGGYVKADFIRDFQYVGDPYEFELGSIAIDGSEESDLGGQISYHAKQSRINFDLRSKAKWKNGKEFPMQVFIEFDWFFDNPAMALNTRLRHAYGVIGRVLVGRTWTTSGDLSCLPGTIDFSGGDALYGGRVTQVRWQDNINKLFTYAVAVEETFAQIDNPYHYDGRFRPMWPNFAAMIRWQAPIGSSLQLGVDVFPVSWIGNDTVPHDKKAGFALTLMGKALFKVSQYKDEFVYGGGYGLGQGHKIIAISWDEVASGVITPTGLDVNPAWFAYVGYNHYWTKSLNSTVCTNWAGTELSPVQPGNLIQRAGSFHINLIWFPYKLVSTGVEYMWGTRINKDGTSGQANRLQFMVKYKFN